ncbi:pyrroloquinoline quinone biosynthesis peptide chaperone PqqD [Sulfitobacter albidus]|uniref:Pyrroloquinoline quinone biosynthesis peptide chaperone PqqD n=1 Tax=Sulfitobacter albidus TaxID=2829501 RepID=A0A975JEB1_9RHOB|nr:pyrroloquinoline quinone biosynthesis peptide chaperone PqqD [Sulfitobacter albidus]QUJ76767.1 pyrroloquinoline quinone biosynthesis peptide chaperone PqqD [Sulfitobacter albidus]
MKLHGTDIPVIPRGVRLHHDRVRARWVLLAPERTIALDPISHAILTALDGARDLDAVVTHLAASYDAPEDQIRGDVTEYITGLMDRRILEVAA